MANCFDMWKEYARNLRKVRRELEAHQKEHLTLPLLDFRRYNRNQRLQTVLREYLQRIRNRIKIKKAVEVFAKSLLPRVLHFES